MVRLLTFAGLVACSAAFAPATAPMFTRDVAVAVRPQPRRRRRRTAFAPRSPCRRTLTARRRLQRGAAVLRGPTGRIRACRRVPAHDAADDARGGVKRRSGGFRSDGRTRRAPPAPVPCAPTARPPAPPADRRQRGRRFFDKNAHTAEVRRSPTGGVDNTDAAGDAEIMASIKYPDARSQRRCPSERVPRRLARLPPPRPLPFARRRRATASHGCGPARRYGGYMGPGCPPGA